MGDVMKQVWRFRDLVEEVLDEGTFTFSKPEIVIKTRGVNTPPTSTIRKYVNCGVLYTPVGESFSVEAQVSFAEVSPRVWNVGFSVESPKSLDKGKYALPLFRGISHIIENFVKQCKPLRLMVAVEDFDPGMRSKMSLYTRMVMRVMPPDFNYVYKTPQLFYVNRAGSEYDREDS